MARLSFFYIAFLALAAGFVVDSLSHAQAPQPVNNIITADGVKLRGTFYENAKANAPTVIMLHAIGDDKSSKSPEWKSLAEALAKAGYSVLLFDFRGHGDSTTIVEPKVFWSKPANHSNVKSKDKESIQVKDYIRNGGAYLPVLVNDIAAARAWLERRNDDNKDCNASNLMIIGAGQGATLGAIWMNAEWHRFKYTPDPMMPESFLVPYPQCVSERSEGRDIIAAVFLTPMPNLEKRTLSLSKILRTACFEKGTATTIFYGKDDVKGAAYAKNLADSLKPKKESSKHAFIGPVPLNTKLTGAKLLQKSLGTEKAIIDYLNLVKDERGSSRSVRNFVGTQYMWRAPNGKLTPAKYDPTGMKGEKELYFDDYSKYTQ